MGVLHYHHVSSQNKGVKGEKGRFNNLECCMRTTEMLMVHPMQLCASRQIVQISLNIPKSFHYMDRKVNLLALVSEAHFLILIWKLRCLNRSAVTWFDYFTDRNWSGFATYIRVPALAGGVGLGALQSSLPMSIILYLWLVINSFFRNIQNFVILQIF